ncbi:hypothetical protein TEQG_08638 [Trichophyton equinum CBS 127.97]|uniref:Uncharacterized protein n=1 Tax=Trichophyton equinum (strain ATCC MYA-4606 / CBS 127.97) TaxID=559882 RepID=F2PNM8_TRIEC|nr:hypothetical protein TEQG_08638 [Trichophyton equinum CBS 127.97]
MNSTIPRRLVPPTNNLDRGHNRTVRVQTEVRFFSSEIKKKGKEKKKIQPQKRGRSPAAAAIQIRNYSEAKATLSCLPKDTPAFEYESASQMEAAARSVDDGGGGYNAYLIITGSATVEHKESDYAVQPRNLPEA